MKDFVILFVIGLCFCEWSAVEHMIGPEVGMREVITTTARLDLVIPDNADCYPLCELWSDPETMRFIGDGSAWDRDKISQRIERAMRMQRDRGMTFWTLIERDTERVVGQGGLVPIEFNGPEVELGYRLGKDFWGNGYATEIAEASAKYGFETLGLDKLVAVTHHENLASRRVLIKTGFVEEGESDVYYSVPTIVHRMNDPRGVR